jgi:hypothetical protein
LEDDAGNRKAILLVVLSASRRLARNHGVACAQTTPRLYPLRAHRWSGSGENERQLTSFRCFRGGVPVRCRHTLHCGRCVPSCSTLSRYRHFDSTPEIHKLLLIAPALKRRLPASPTHLQQAAWRMLSTHPGPLFQLAHTTETTAPSRPSIAPTPTATKYRHTTTTPTPYPAHLFTLALLLCRNHPRPPLSAHLETRCISGMSQTSRRPLTI